MSEFVHQTLIHVVVDLVGGTVVAQNLISDLSGIGAVGKISSVYKRYLGKNHVDMNANIEVVFRFGTNCAVDELLWHFKQYTKEKKANLNLLSYDDLVILSPQLTLPHPNLHRDFLIVRCASEAWAQYEHPIVQKTLGEIAAVALPAVDAEFFLQGKSLVDF